MESKADLDSESQKFSLHDFVFQWLKDLIFYF
jgi:hypothetical protein